MGEEKASKILEEAIASTLIFVVIRDFSLPNGFTLQHFKRGQLIRGRDEAQKLISSFIPSECPVKQVENSDILDILNVT